MQSSKRGHRQMERPGISERLCAMRVPIVSGGRALIILCGEIWSE